MAKSATPRNKLLVVGSSADSDCRGSRSSSGSSGEHNITHPARFVASLMAGGKQREAEEEEQLNQDPDDDSVVFWTIETKYYKAELALHLAAKAGSPSGGQPKQEKESFPFFAPGKDFQGIIVVWKGGGSPGENEISGLKEIEPWLRAASAQDSLKLCLVVGILDSNSKDAERPSGRALEDDDDDSMQRRRSVWCLKYGFEYVEVDYTRQVRMLPKELREKEGLERVCECIEATSWQYIDCCSSGRSLCCRPGEPDEKVCEQPQDKAGSLASDQNDVNLTCRTRLGHSNVAEGTQDKHGEEWEDDAGLERLFAKFHAERERAHSGQYDDEQRRARAAEMALQFALKLGIFEDDE